MEIGIIGGTGPAGQALATRLAANGHRVTLGSRDKERSVTLAKQLVAAWPTFNLDIRGSLNEEMDVCSIYVLATPWEASVTTARSLHAMLEGKVLISMVNALAKVGNEFQALVLSRGSVAASIQSVLPLTNVAAAFQHIPARELGAIDTSIDCDVLICADTPRADNETAAVVASIAGLRPVSCGSLASANAVEALTAVMLNVNIRYKTHASLRLTGLEALE